MDYVEDIPNANWKFVGLMHVKYEVVSCCNNTSKQNKPRRRDLIAGFKCFLTKWQYTSLSIMIPVCMKCSRIGPLQSLKCMSIDFPTDGVPLSPARKNIVNACWISLSQA